MTEAAGSSAATVELDPELYGRCHRGACLCLRPDAQWIGTRCIYWTPVRKMTMAEYVAWLGEPLDKDKKS